METSRIDELATAHWKGEITSDRFVRETSPHWRRIAADVYRRWRKKLPPSVELEDVEQTFLMEVLWAISYFDPKAGLSISKYLTWSATKRTQRAIHKMRGARIHGNEGKNASRPEVTFTKWSSTRARGDGGERSEPDPLDLVPIFATQDAAAAIREILSDALFDAESIREAFVMLALRECGGDPDDAAMKLFESFSARVECGLRDVEHARRVVGGTVAEAFGGGVRDILDASVDAA